MTGLVSELKSELERAHETITQLQLGKGAANHEATRSNGAASTSSDGGADGARVEALTIEVIGLRQQLAFWKGQAEGLREETGQLERAAESARSVQAAELKPEIWREAERLRQQVAELQERHDHSLRLQREVDRLRKRSAEADAHELELESSVKRISRMEGEHAEAHRLFQVERGALRDEIARLRTTVAEFESGLVHQEQSEQTLQRCAPFADAPNGQSAAQVLSALRGCCDGFIGCCSLRHSATEASQRALEAEQRCEESEKSVRKLKAQLRTHEATIAELEAGMVGKEQVGAARQQTMDAELNRLRSEILELEHALGAAERMNLARKTKWEEEETKLRRQVVDAESTTRRQAIDLTILKRNLQELECRCAEVEAQRETARAECAAAEAKLATRPNAASEHSLEQRLKLAEARALTAETKLQHARRNATEAVSGHTNGVDPRQADQRPSTGECWRQILAAFRQALLEWSADLQAPSGGNQDVPTRHVLELEHMRSAISLLSKPASHSVASEVELALTNLHELVAELARFCDAVGVGLHAHVDSRDPMAGRAAGAGLPTSRDEELQILEQCRADLLGMQAATSASTQGASEVQRRALDSNSGEPAAQLRRASKRRTKNENERYLVWLNSLGVADPIRIEHLAAEARNGLLLCKVVNFFTPTAKLTGINKKPLSKSACIANIDKAVSLVMRKGAKFSNMPTAEDVYDGKVDKLLLLLREMFNAFVLRQVYQHSSAMLQWFNTVLAHYNRTLVLGANSNVLGSATELWQPFADGIAISCVLHFFNTATASTRVDLSVFYDCPSSTSRMQSNIEAMLQLLQQCLIPLYWSVEEWIERPQMDFLFAQLYAVIIYIWRDHTSISGGL